MGDAMRVVSRIAGSTPAPSASGGPGPAKAGGVLVGRLLVHVERRLGPPPFYSNHELRETTKMDISTELDFSPVFRCDECHVVDDRHTRYDVRRAIGHPDVEHLCNQCAAADDYSVICEDCQNWVHPSDCRDLDDDIVCAPCYEVLAPKSESVTENHEAALG